MSRKPRSLILAINVLLLPLLLILPACVPSITREMLTPSPTITKTPLPTHTPDPNQTPTPTLSPQEVLLPAITALDGLLLEQYPLAQADGYDLQPGSLDQNQKFYERIPAGVFDQHQDRWAQPPSPTLDEVNAKLKDFNYHLEKTSTSDSARSESARSESARYTIYQGSQVLHNNVTYFGSIQVNTSKSDFLLPLTLNNSEVWILQKDRFEKWFSDAPRFLPVFGGDDVFAIGQPGEITQNDQKVLGVQILKNGEPVYDLPLPYTGANKCPIQNFRAWGHEWVLEMDGTVVRDGQSLAEKNGYAQVFDWQVLNAKEFFLFEKNGKYGISYSGKEMPVQFDTIVRWPCIDQQGGQGYNFSARGNDRIAGFFAQKDGVWYYTEVTPLQ
jgi:hypothetical protein